MKTLSTKLSEFHQLKDAELDAFLSRCKKRELKKGEHLLMQGDVCKNIYFLDKGIIRGYYYLEDKEVSSWFGFEEYFVTSFYSYISAKPSMENLQAIEDSVLWSLSKQAIEELFDQFPTIERMVRKAYETYYIRLENRYVNAQFKSAAERYQELMETSPQILQRVPLGYVASYLGISQETLSRIRKTV